MLCVASALLCSRAAGTTYTWTGNGGNGLLNAIGNWDLVLPVGSNTTELVFAGSNNVGTAATPLVQNLLNPFVINRLTFASGVGNVYLGGSDFRIGGTSAAITQNSSSAISITNPFRGSNNGLVTVNLTGTGSGIVTMSGVIEAGSGSNRDYALVKSGTSTFSLTGINTYGGGTTIDGGRLMVNNASSLGTGGLRINNGTLQVTATYSSGQAISLGDANSTFDIDAGRTFTSTGTMSGTGALNKVGSGTMVLSGAINYSGGTNVAAGELRLGGSDRLLDTGAVTISGGTLNLGTFSDTVGAVTVQSGSITGTGTLTASSYALQSGSIASTLAGTAGLTKSTAGTLTLTGVNTYTGGTTINAGTIVVNSAASLGAVGGGLSLNAGTLRVSSGFATNRVFTLGSSASAISVDSGQTLTVNSAIAGTGALNTSGTGTLVVAGQNTFSGGTNVQAGTLRLGAAERLINSGAVTVSGGTLDLQTFNETVGGVTLASGSIIGSGTLSGSSYILQSGSASAVLGGSGGVTKTTSGIVTLSGVNSYTGATAVNAGRLNVNSNGALGSAASGTIVAPGATLHLAGVNYSRPEQLTINGSGVSNGGALANSGTSTFAGHVVAATHSTINAGGGVLNFTGGLTKNGTTLTIAGGGTVNISGQGIGGSSPNSDLVVDGTEVVLNAASTYNGPTTIQNSGTLRLGASNVLPTTPRTALAVNSSSTFDLAGSNDGVASLSGDSSGTVRNSVKNGTSILTINPGSGTSTTFAGTIAGTNGGAQGDVAVVKSGAGELILSRTNTFTGSTTVSGGTLTAASASGGALGSTSAIVVGSGGTLLLGGSNQINDTAPVTLAGGTIGKGSFSEGSTSTPGFGALTLTASGSRLDFGTGNVGTLTFASLAPGALALTIDNWSGAANTVGSSSTDRLIFDTDQTSNLSYFNFSGYNSGARQFDLGNGFYEIAPMTPVPEPGTYVAGSLAVAALLFEIRRRRRAASA